MKSTLFFFICICTLSRTQAQDRPHRIIVGCTANYLNGYGDIRNGSGNKSSNFSDHQVGLHPNIGFKLDAYWMIGLGGGLSYSRRSGYNAFSREEFTHTSSAYSIEVFGRRYFGTDKTVQFFLEPSFEHTKFRLDSISPAYTNIFIGSKKEYQCTIAPGISWSVSRLFNFIARFGSLGYVWGTEDSANYSNRGVYRYFGLHFSTTTFFIGAELKL